MKPFHPNITRYDAYPYEELVRPYFPEKIAAIEKAVRKYLAKTLAPQGENHHHDEPPVSINTYADGPEKLDLKQTGACMLRNFTITSAAARSSRMEKMISDMRKIIGDGLSGIEPSTEDIAQRLSAIDGEMTDGTLCLEIFEHPECLDQAFATVLEQTRKQFFEYFADVALMLQCFHPLDPTGKDGPPIPPAISLRRMHPGDRVFLAAPREQAIHERLFGRVVRH